MTVGLPLYFEWTAEGTMRPILPQRKRAAETFVVGERYRLEAREERSGNSHRHYFASIKTTWDNLRDEDQKRWPSPDHLRAWALVRAGYASKREIVCDTEGDAMRLARTARSLAALSIITVAKNVVTIYEPQSQSVRHMNREIFQRSKDDVFRVLAEIIGTDPGTLANQNQR